MICDKCSAQINDSYQHLGRQLCEDCYMDALSPARTCDPWAAYNAKSFEGKPVVLDAPQIQMLDVLKRQGPMAPEDLLASLGGDWTSARVEREFATLKRLEKIRAVKDGTRILLRLF